MMWVVADYEPWESTVSDADRSTFKRSTLGLPGHGFRTGTAAGNDRLRMESQVWEALAVNGVRIEDPGNLSI